jgi:hypothetical protein
MCENRPDDGGSKHLWNVGLVLRDYTAQYPRRLLLTLYHRRDNLKSYWEAHILYSSISHAVFEIKVDSDELKITASAPELLRSAYIS